MHAFGRQTDGRTDRQPSIARARLYTQIRANISTCGCVCDTEARDPCATVRCYFGAQCVASADLLTGTCECPSANETECSADEPVCGDDMRDYRNVCHLNTTSCQRRRHITVKYRGKCGTFSLTYLLTYSLSVILC